jgi:hypothetical protein
MVNFYSARSALVAMSTFLAMLALTCVAARAQHSTPVGVYAGNSVEDVQKFEAWLGRKVDYVAAHVGRQSWQDWESSLGWQIKLWDGIDRPRRWNIPIFPDGGSLDDAAAGKYDFRYVRAARRLAASRPQDDVVIIRTGEEFNGDWMPWKAEGKEKVFAQAFRHFVQAFRSVSDRFRFEWNVNVGDYGADPEEAYPGDDVVDIIGMDFYYNLKWYDRDPMKAWDFMVTRKYGLAWHQDFAKAHSKPTAYSEWGIPSNDSAPYIEKAKDWFDSHNVLYQIYWDSNADFRGKLSNGQFPKSGAAFRAAFGTP